MSSTTDEAAAQGAAAAFSRVAACVEYSGTAYRGWQRQQPGVKSVQEEVEKALSRGANHPVQLVCAGRTDAGVHAACQIIHFDTSARRTPENWLHAANSTTPLNSRPIASKPAGLD